MKRLAAAIALFAAISASSALAQTQAAFGVRKVIHYPEDGARVFTFEVASRADRDVRLRGRAVLINVYDTSRPTIVPFGNVPLSKGGAAPVTIRWAESPLAGRVRVLLILTDGQQTFVESFDIWLVPLQYVAAAAAAVLLLIAIIIALLFLPRLLRAAKRHVPSGMVAHVVEPNDTVVALSNRFGVSWQDIVKANRLKPPYTLTPGSRLLIPKRLLQRPADEP